jgi:hypothetical protein
MQDAVSEWPKAARRRFPWRLSRNVIDSVSSAGAEFARNGTTRVLVSERSQWPGARHINHSGVQN